MNVKFFMLSAVCALSAYVPSAAYAQVEGQYYMREVLLKKGGNVAPDPGVTPDPVPTPIPDPNPSPTPDPEPAPLVCTGPVSTFSRIVVSQGVKLTNKGGKNIAQVMEMCQNYATSSGQPGTCGWYSGSGLVTYWWATTGTGTSQLYNNLITCK